VNKFLCGVDGVIDAGTDVVLECEWLGGVCDRVGSLIVVECEEDGSGSGEWFGGVG
jgi:hypothetical protein